MSMPANGHLKNTTDIVYLCMCVFVKSLVVDYVCTSEEIQVSCALNCVFQPLDPP